MNFELSKEQSLLQAMARDFAEKIGTHSPAD